MVADKRQIRHKLTDPEVEVRLDGVRCLYQLQPFPAELFVLGLGDEDWRVRKEAAIQFMKFTRNDCRTAFLVEQLGHPENAGLRNAAIEILINLGALVVPELTAHLHRVDSEVRKFIIDILGEIGDCCAVPMLLPYLRDPDDNVSYATVETLGKLKMKTSAAPLVDLLETAEVGLRFGIFEALANIGAGVPVERIIPYCEDRLLRKSVFACLGRLGRIEALPVLARGLNDPLKKSRETALLAIGELLQSLPPTLPLPQLRSETAEFKRLILDYLQHEDLRFRQAACYTLGLQPDPDLLKHLLPSLRDEELRPHIINLCRRLPQPLLREMLNHQDSDSELLCCLIFLFGELGDQTITPFALRKLAAADPQLRYASVRTLGKVGAVEAISELGDRFLDPVIEIREAAADALRILGGRASAAVAATLTPYLEADDPNLRLLAVRTLAGLPSGQALDALLLAIKDPAAEVRCEALRSLKGGDTAQLLTQFSIALTDEEAAVRRLAAEALDAFPPQQVLPILRQVMEDPDPWVRMAAIRALPGGSAAEIAALVERGINDDVGLVVIAGLETAYRLMADRSRELLFATLEHEDREVVVTAVRLLLQSGQAEILLSHRSALVRLLTARNFSKALSPDWQRLIAERLSLEENDEVHAALLDALHSGQLES